MEYGAFKYNGLCAFSHFFTFGKHQKTHTVQNEQFEETFTLETFDFLKTIAIQTVRQQKNLRISS